MRTTSRLLAAMAILAMACLEWHRWLAADARGYAFAARIAREVISRDMVTRGQRARILTAAGGPSNPTAGSVV
jgi:hypothetical protein